MVPIRILGVKIMFLDHTTYDDVLRQWDQAWQLGCFPHMGTTTFWGFVKARLSVFRSSDEWITIFELLVYKPGGGNVDIVGYAFGNKIRLKHAPFLEFLKLPPLRIPQCEDSDAEDDWWCRNPFELTYLVDGSVRTLSVSPAKYTEAGIDLYAPISGDDVYDRVLRSLRMLAYHYPPDAFFYSTDDLLVAAGRPSDIPLFLQLYHWCNPGVGGIHKPSDSPCLRNLAKAIANYQPDQYYCDESLINTHWSYWPIFVEK